MSIRVKTKVDIALLKQTRAQIDRIIAQMEDVKNANKIEITEWATESDLQPKEKFLLDFIRDHQGLSKQQIIDSPEIKSKIGTRNPVFRYLTRLEEYGLILTIPDELNSQLHHVYVNYENRIMMAINDIEEFERSYFLLLRSAIKRYFKILKEDQKSASELLISISALNTHFIGLYIVNLVYVWPREIQEKVTLNRLYTVVFSKLKQIQEKISSEFTGLTWDLASHLALAWFQLYPFRLESMYKNFEKNDLTNLADSVIDSLWRIKGPFHPVGGRTLKLKDEYDDEDWKDMLNDQREAEAIQKRRKASKV